MNIKHGCKICSVFRTDNVFEMIEHFDECNKYRSIEICSNCHIKKSDCFPCLKINICWECFDIYYKGCLWIVDKNNK